MRTTSLMAALLVAAALAGCTGGTSNEGQPPDDRSTSDAPAQTRSDTRGPGGQQGRGNDRTYDAHLEVSPDNGTAPLNVTLAFGATWQDNGRRAGQDGDRPDSNGTGNQTGGPGGNSTGNRGNGTGNGGSHPVNGGHNVTWTLEVRLVSGGASGSGNATGNGTTQGDGAGNQTATGNQTGNTTTQTSTGNGGSQTSSQTSTSTAGSGNETGTGDGTTANGTLIVSFNGTDDDLPGNETVLLNETGSYTVTFTVTTEDGTAIVRDASVAVEPLPPGSPLGNETRTFEGSFLVSEPLLLCTGSEDFEWALNGTFDGTLADVSHVNATVESSGFADVELTLVAPNGTEVQSGAEINATGPFEPGNYTLTAESCVSADAEFTITAVAHYVTKASFG